MRSIGSKRNCRVAYSQVAELRARLGAALRNALKARDPRAIDALRSLMIAIANAEAVDDIGERAASPKIGIGSGDVPRRQLSAQDLIAIAEREIAERMLAAAEYDRLGRADEAAALRDQTAVLRRFLEGST